MQQRHSSVVNGVTPAWSHQAVLTNSPGADVQLAGIILSVHKLA
jgi:hypothetical protein